ncbi:hypothetical protein NA57DRAFT_52094 [Rhizodiscina lignyota]|uniref:BTB domain-containing protein n=1 Tax=Rhizodiscina lignyota TaxID=1504668 RepID=A0A9P4IQR2_9PEZI|nr:hypothetical protein NA57DRAFT_52094 [Rhizodiscina lignyota]
MAANANAGTSDDPLVIFKLGHEKIEAHIRKSHLCMASRHFRNHFMHNENIIDGCVFKVGVEDEIHLPLVSHTTFASFKNFVYGGGRIYLSHMHSLLTGVALDGVAIIVQANSEAFWEEMLDLYIFALKYKCDGLRNEVLALWRGLNAIVSSTSDYSAPQHTIMRAYGCLRDEDRLIQEMIRHARETLATL